jgi:asparagine synthase (glutamine-hydrolysing)
VVFRLSGRYNRLAVCGIAGVFGLGLGEAHTSELVRAMCVRIAHRGPDGDGSTSHGDLAMGMVRLAIVDIAEGKQPMLSGDGQVALVFNGEIYNASRLRRELEEAGVRFRTHSDTEVILRLYERNPDDVERHLAGMWAFCVHDRRRNRMVVSRDRFGIKPLYVLDRDGAFAFASELGALEPLRAHARFAPAFAVDRGAAHAMLAWSYIPNEETIYAGVRRLAPATRLEVDLETGRRIVQRHYTLRASDDARRVKSLGDACALIEPLLRRSVREHLASDVPIASFLSGGVDSSLVLALASEETTRPIQAFCIGFKEKRFDESPYARRVAERLGIDLHVEVFDDSAARASLDDALAAYDEPFGDSSSLATFMLSRVVSRTHKVALGGDGGDEVFAGYRKHQIVRLRHMIERAPLLRALVARALRALPARTDRSSRLADTLRTARRVARGLEGDDGAAYCALTQVASLEKVAPLATDGADLDRFTGPILKTFASAEGTVLQKTLASDLANVLPNDMLTKIDRASMACGLEARVPMLDHRVVEAGLGLPAPFTINGSGKRVLRELYRRRFGDELANRKKTGFGVPVETWMRGPLASKCASVMSGPSDVLRVSRDAWSEWLARDPQVLWHVFALRSWEVAH